MATEHFKSKEAYRRNLAYRHIHGIPFTAKNVVVGGKEHAVKHSTDPAREKIDAKQRAKTEMSKYRGSVSSYDRNRPKRKIVKRSFGNA